MTSSTSPNDSIILSAERDSDGNYTVPTIPTAMEKSKENHDHIDGGHYFRELSRISNHLSVAGIFVNAFDPIHRDRGRERLSSPIYSIPSKAKPNPYALALELSKKQHLIEDKKREKRRQQRKARQLTKKHR